MNITELARILKITPQELKDSLPKLGFDIGQKAIKINRNVANKIIRDWPRLKRRLEAEKERERREREEKEKRLKIKKTIQIPPFITVRDLAALSEVPVQKILAELLKNGVVASLNEKIDFDTAWLVGSELGLTVKRKKEDETVQKKKEEEKLKAILAAQKDQLQPRPPVIVVMGHVDHGKTKLLDVIRKTNIVAGEAGGITQHIGAYQVERQGRLITFIDTPGHEAFTAMRSRGAKIADIAILVVAADDGVKPQTIEAYKIIQSAGIPFVVAINKIDKPEANIDKTKQELSSQLNITPEDWGGKTICVPISALAGTGIDELLDMVLLTADTEVKNIKANPNAPAVGTIIESHIHKGAGPIATILVQNGTLRVGDQLVLDKIIIGKARNLYDFRGQKITHALPSAPAQIIGLKTMPEVGDIIRVGEGKKIKLKKIKTQVKPAVVPVPGKETEEQEAKKKINLIIKSDVLGSAEAIEESLLKIATDEVGIKIIHKGLGNITDGDLKRAEAAGTQIVGFNVKISPLIGELAREKNIKIKIYNIIYDLINDIKKEIRALTEPHYQRIDLGEVEVLAIFKTEKNSQIVGGRVKSGVVEIGAMVEVLSKGEPVAEGKITHLQSAKQDVASVDTGQECGIRYEGQPVIKKGNILRIFKKKEIIND
jgi:translation initiation factor IF-2